MKKRRTKRVIRAAVLLAALAAAGFTAAGCKPAENPTIVVCVGDSITKGVGVMVEKTQSYPAVLARKLGGGYRVINLGVSGATVASEVDRQYIESKQYRESLQSGADTVVIALGTNDCRTSVWNAAEFEAAYRKLLADYDAFERIVVLPSPIHITARGYSDAILREEAIPIIRRLAGEEGLKVVDAYSALYGHPEYLADGVHPNARGARVLAKRVADAIR